MYKFTIKRLKNITTLCQSFNCSSCYDLWQSWLPWKSTILRVCCV